MLITTDKKTNRTWSLPLRALKCIEDEEIKPTKAVFSSGKWHELRWWGKSKGFCLTGMEHIFITKQEQLAEVFIKERRKQSTLDNDWKSRANSEGFGDTPSRNTRRQSGKRDGMNEKELSSKEPNFEGHFRELILSSLSNGESLQVLEEGVTDQ